MVKNDFPCARVVVYPCRQSPLAPGDDGDRSGGLWLRAGLWSPPMRQNPCPVEFPLPGPFNAWAASPTRFGGAGWEQDDARTLHSEADHTRIEDCAHASRRERQLEEPRVYPYHR